MTDVEALADLLGELDEAERLGTVDACRELAQALVDAGVRPPGDSAGEPLSIVLELAEVEPIVFDVTTGSGARCAFCDAMPPGAALTLAVTQHRLGCLWRHAVTFRDDLRKAET